MLGAYYTVSVQSAENRQKCLKSKTLKMRNVLINLQTIGYRTALVHLITGHVRPLFKVEMVNTDYIHNSDSVSCIHNDFGVFYLPPAPTPRTPPHIPVWLAVDLEPFSQGSK